MRKLVFFNSNFSYFYKILIIFVLSIVVFLYFKYLSKVNIYQPISITVKSKNFQENKNFGFYSVSPNGKYFKLYFDKTNRTWKQNYGFNNCIILSFKDSLLSDIFPLNIKIGNNIYSFDKSKFLEDWKLTNNYNNENLTYQSPNYIKGNTNLILKAFSILLWGGLIRIIIISLFFISCIYFIYKILKKHKDFVVSKLKFCGNLIYNLFSIHFSSLITVANVYKFCILIVVIYSIIFFNLCKFTNEAIYIGDTPDYQNIAVNFAKNHRFPYNGIIEKFETYKFSQYNSDFPQSFEKSNLNFFRNPGYPFFLGIIYKIFGVSPLIAKYIQLFLLIIVASFLPLIGFYLWNSTGFKSGIVASPLFIYTNVSISQYIMSEPLIIFFVFLIVLAYIYYNIKNDGISSIILSITFGLGILVKGSLIFIPALFFLFLFVKFYKTKNNTYLKHLYYQVVTIIFIISPWSAFASNKTHKLVILTTQANFMLLDGHNEYLSKNEYSGSSKWVNDKSSFYNNDKMQGVSSVKRVINFYMHYPQMIYKLAIGKILTAFSPFIFFWLFLIIYLIDKTYNFLRNLFKKQNKNYAKLSVIFIVLIFAYILFILNNISVFYAFAFLLIMSIIISLISRSKAPIIEIPVIFYIIFLNSLLITLIFMVAGGSQSRYVCVMDFIFILTSIYYLYKFILYFFNKSINTIN